MAHFAELDSNNIVLRVVVISNYDVVDENENEVEQIGIDFCKQMFGGDNWKQTSYNHNFRERYAMVGGYYDEQKNVFIDKKPFDSWVLNDQNVWEAPVPYPDDTDFPDAYVWDESTTSWVSIIT